MGVKSSWKQMKSILKEQLFPRDKWDKNFEQMSKDGHIRALNFKNVVHSWQATHKDDTPSWAYTA